MRSEKLMHYSQKFPMSRNEPRTIWLVFVLVLAAANSSLFAQAPAATLELSHPAQAADGAAANDTPLTITLQDALERARANDPQYHSPITDLRLPRDDRVQPRPTFPPA